jgi:hypothetical protein
MKFPTTIELKIGSVQERFKFDFSICRNPDCDCNGVSMVLFNEKTAIQFFLDLKTETYTEKDYSKDEYRTLTEFIKFLKSPDNCSLNLEFFKENYKFVKDRVKYGKEIIANYGFKRFIKYNDIFWDEEEIKIKADKNYILFDSYCVAPNCTCTEVGLDIFEEVYSISQRIPDFSFVYDYKTGNYRDAIGIDEEGIKSFIPKSFNKKIKERHERLKKEVKKFIKPKLVIPNSIKKRKLGRNEPCHCGSGNKYKKCCLNSDVGKYGCAMKVDCR